jgi:hypothetical protein
LINGIKIAINWRRISYIPEPGKSLVKRFNIGSLKLVNESRLLYKEIKLAPVMGVFLFSKKPQVAT